VNSTLCRDKDGVGNNRASIGPEMLTGAPRSPVASVSKAAR
jgi:hypothetical protein